MNKRETIGIQIWYQRMTPQVCAVWRSYFPKYPHFVRALFARYVAAVWMGGGKPKWLSRLVFWVVCWLLAFKVRKHKVKE